ncbi:hypothetical protein EDD18DRAFT_548724 [Armillaria luteobubalina]|uniref:Uncharacterized protein n=1 Tax=Armillaria luteobubalina TaxID=153913 RepID=A0AA39PUU0_9AGAR|nr:hypothetical protein EDD18DRAFT_548724 [Armillaria luteobubalina]
MSWRAPWNVSCVIPYVVFIVSEADFQWRCTTGSNAFSSVTSNAYIQAKHALNAPHHRLKQRFEGIAGVDDSTKGDNAYVNILEASGKAENVDTLLIHGFLSVLILPQQVLAAV